jgi:transposase
MMNITTVGVDLAKDVITVCAQDSAGRMVDRGDLRCTAFAPWLAQLPAGCVVGMEACSSAHHWARTMRALELAVREMVTIAREHLALLDLRIAECDRAIAAACRQDPAARRVQAVSGVGVLTADATTASVGDAREFKNGRQFAAWIGITPRQYSSGGKTKLGGITRRGDAYLRTLSKPIRSAPADYNNGSCACTRARVTTRPSLPLRTSTPVCCGCCSPKEKPTTPTRGSATQARQTS